MPVTSSWDEHKDKQMMEQQHHNVMARKVFHKDARSRSRSGSASRAAFAESQELRRTEHEIEVI